MSGSGNPATFVDLTSCFAVSHVAIGIVFAAFEGIPSKYFPISPSLVKNSAPPPKTIATATPIPMKMNFGK